MTDWITHKGTEPPLLAPAALVEVVARNGYKNFQGHQRTKDRVDRVAWAYVHEYRPLTDEHGRKYVSAEGLEQWAKFVVTSPGGVPVQFERRPWIELCGWALFHGRNREAPATHRHPGNYRDSLYRVWR